MTAFVVATAVILAVSLVLWASGRSWMIWHRAATPVLLVWWMGVNLGRSGMQSWMGKLVTIFLLVGLAEPAVRIFRAALQPRSKPRAARSSPAT